MKPKIFILFTTVLLSFPSFGQDKEFPLFILPKGSSHFLCKYENDKIVQIKALDIFRKGKYCMSNKGTIASTDSSGKKLKILRVDNTGKITMRREITLPDSIQKLASIKMYNDENLLLGHGYGLNKIVVYNIPNRTFHYTSIPTTHSFPKKSIDDFIIENDSLLAVDNVVFPKYIFIYSTDSFPHLRYVRTINLKANGPDESIHKAISNGQYIFLLSSTFGGGGTNYFITALQRTEMDIGASLRSEDYYAKRKTKNDGKYLFKTNYQFTDILANGGHLYIACPQLGLGFIKIFDLDLRWENTLKEKDSYSRLNKLPSYKAFENIVSLLKIPNTDVIVGISKIKDIWDYRILQVNFFDW